MALALRTPFTGIASVRAGSPTGWMPRARPTGAGAGAGTVSSRTSPHSGVWMLRNTLACDATLITSSRTISPSAPVGVTVVRSTPRSRASLRIGGLAITPAEERTGRSAGLRRRETASPPLPYPTSTDPDAAAGASGAAGAGAAASASVRNVMIGVPTSIVRPSSTSSSPTMPACGDGSSTRDFAVSISQITSLTATASPGATFQATISASVRPSPTSGRVKV